LSANSFQAGLTLMLSDGGGINRRLQLSSSSRRPLHFVVMPFV